MTLHRSYRFLIVLPAGIAAFSTLPGADEPPPRVATAPSVTECLVSRTNAARGEQKLPALTVDQRLTAAAQGLADHMARTRQLSHTADQRSPAQRVEAQGYRWTYVAENIAYRSAAGVTADDTARLLVEQWLNSPGHRSNLLSSQARHLGCGSATAQDGSVYAVQVFAHPAVPADRATASPVPR